MYFTELVYTSIEIPVNEFCVKRQERRAVVVPRINLLPTDCQPFVVFFHRIIFPDIIRMKRFHREKKATVYWSAAGNKERFSSQ